MKLQARNCKKGHEKPIYYLSRKTTNKLTDNIQGVSSTDGFFEVARMVRNNVFQKKIFNVESISKISQLKNLLKRLKFLWRIEGFIYL